MHHGTGSIVAGFKITTIIDAGGRVITSDSRPMTVEELAPLFATAERRGLDLKRGTEIDHAPARIHDQTDTRNVAQDHRRDPRPSSREVDQAGTDEEGRKLLEYSFSLGCDTRRIKELMTEFPPRRVGRALTFLQSLIEKDQDIKDPTALVVAQVLRWSKVTK